MADVTFKVCDRCGEKLKEHRLLVKKRRRRFKLLRTSPDPYGYWETEYELCKSCGDKLFEFMRGKE